MQRRSSRWSLYSRFLNVFYPGKAIHLIEQFLTLKGVVQAELGNNFSGVPYTSDPTVASGRLLVGKCMVFLKPGALGLYYTGGVLDTRVLLIALTPTSFERAATRAVHNNVGSKMNDGRNNEGRCCGKGIYIASD